MMSDPWGAAPSPAKAKRIVFIDEARALCILHMVYFHIMYDLTAIFGVNIPWFGVGTSAFIRDIFTAGFMLIAGISCHFSRDNWLRGGRVLLCALGVTLVTWLFMPGQLVTFGILHFMGVSMLLYALFCPLLRRVRPGVGLMVSFLLWALTRNTGRGFWDLFGLWRMPLPCALYGFSWLFPLGITTPRFFSADYYPLLPWFFIFLGGAFAGGLLREATLPRWFYQNHLPPLAFIGRHSMAIYLVHQPVIYGLLYLLFHFAL